MRPASRHQSAFTLVEVLVALLIFTVAAVMLGASYLNVLNNYELVRQNQAVEEDLRFIRSLVLQEKDRDELEQGGDLDSLYLGRVTWRTTLIPALLPDLFQVLLEIEYAGTEQVTGRMETQEFYLLRPEWSDPLERERLRAESTQRHQERLQQREQ